MKDHKVLVRKRALILMQELCIYFTTVLPPRDNLRSSLEAQEKTILDTTANESFLNSFELENN